LTKKEKNRPVGALKEKIIGSKIGILQDKN
jgi:hypothetical protein